MFNYNIVARASILFGIIILTFLVSYNYNGTSWDRIIRLLILPVIVCAAFYRPLTSYLESRSSINSKSSLVIIIASYIFIAVVLKVSKMTSMNYEFFDYGLYLNKVWRICSADDTYKAIHIAVIEGHFQPILLTYRYLGLGNYIFYIPIIQSLLIGLSAIFIYMASMSCFKTKIISLLITWLYLYNPIVLFVDILGFHPDTFAMIMFPLFIYGMIRRKFNLASFSALVIGLAGEVYLATTILMFVFIYIKTKQIRYLCLSIFYFVCIAFLYFYILPNFSEYNNQNLTAESSPYSYLLNGEFIEILSTFINTRKIYFLFYIFAPFIYTPLTSWMPILIGVPEFAKLFLSIEPFHYSVEGHYLVVLYPVIFFSFLYNICYNKKLRRYKYQLIAYAVSMNLGLLLSHSPYPFSIDFISLSSSATYNYAKYIPDERTETIEKLDHQILKFNVKNLQISNSLITPSIIKMSTMPKIFPNNQTINADFVALDGTRFNSTGGDRYQDSYTDSYKSHYEKLSEAHIKVFDEKGIELWAPCNQTIKNCIK